MKTLWTAPAGAQVAASTFSTSCSGNKGGLNGAANSPILLLKCPPHFNPLTSGQPSHFRDVVSLNGSSKINKVKYTPEIIPILLKPLEDHREALISVPAEETGPES